MKIICMIRSLCLGGAERQLTGLAIRLKEAGNDVEVLTYHDADFYAGMLDEAGVRRTFIPKDRHIVRHLAEHFREERPDLVISYLVGPSVKACKARKYFSGFKLAVSERNVNTWTGPHDIWRFRHFRRADYIITNSHAQEQYIRRRFPSCAPKTKTIVNFVDTVKFHPAEAYVPHIPQHIVTTARVDSRKNVLGYIKALSILRGRGRLFVAEWYGLKDSGDRYYGKCIKEAEKAGLEGCFRILPATQDIAPVYRNADIFCLPSFYEGTPNSLAEALSSGLPAVASDVSDNHLYVTSSNGFLCDPRSPESIAAALDKLLCESASERKSRRVSSRETAERMLGSDVFLNSYLNILSEIQAETF